MVKNILLTSDGIIIIVGSDWELPELQLQESEVKIKVMSFGLELQICDLRIELNSIVLEHLEDLDSAWFNFYGANDSSVLAEYQGRIVVNRDLLLKGKGAWEYASSLCRLG